MLGSANFQVRFSNDFPSFIDVSDLTELELAALENKNARGK